ncbi:hypothetical protein LXL04_029719 [Taraxacum kok-saghyz]
MTVVDIKHKFDLVYFDIKHKLLFWGEETDVVQGRRVRNCSEAVPEVESQETDVVQGRRVRTCSEAVPEVESQVGGSDRRLATDREGGPSEEKAVKKIEKRPI